MRFQRLEHCGLTIALLSLAGILAATAVALAEDDSELELRIVDAVSMSFWIGARAQQVSGREPF